MNKLIMIPGNVSSSFFLNELPIARQYYDAVCIIDFSGNQAIGDSIVREYGFRYYNCKLSLRTKGFLREFLRWMQTDYVRREISENAGFSISGLKKLFYIAFYGLYSVLGKKIINKEIDTWDGTVDLYSYWLSRPAFLAAQYNEKRCSKIRHIISRAHGYDLYLDRNSTNYLPFRRYIDCNVDIIYFISENGKRYYDSKYPSLGVELVAKREISRLGTYGTVKKKMRRDNKNILFASCSSVIPIKRLDLIVDVVAGLEQYGIRWVHFGDGNQMEMIADRCKKKLRKESYQFYGNIANKHLLQAYEELDVDFFINLSDSEGIPVSIMEAMSFGIPVIARNVGGVSEIVTNANGLLLEEFDVDSMVSEIRKLLDKIASDWKIYESLCLEARKTWDCLYNAEKNYKQFYISVTSEEM